MGGIGWVASMSLGGYALGRAVPNISKYMHAVVITIIVLSCVPIAVEIYRERRKASTDLDDPRLDLVEARGHSGRDRRPRAPWPRQRVDGLEACEHLGEVGDDLHGMRRSMLR